MTQKSDRRYRTALFPGSFNPFTRGHEDIVRRTLQICDRVIVAVGHNIEKSDSDIAPRVDAIRGALADLPGVSVISYSGLTGELAHHTGADFIVRGVRSVTDFEYETNMADANRNMFGVETLLMPARPELAWISSSVVRELNAFGADTHELLPSDKS